MWKYLRNDRGSIVVIVAGALIMLLGFTALVTDIGMMVYRKSKLQNACDAAALAGAQELPGNTTEAENVARQYAVNNGITNPTITFDEDDPKIIVRAKEEVTFFFARALGINKGDVSAQAAAIVAPINKVYSGLRPFGVVDDVFTYNQQVTLKSGSQDGQSGNFGALRLDEAEGTSDYNKQIIEGCITPYKVGDSISTEPGVKPEKTIKGVQECIDNGIRVITVPIIDSLGVPGTSKEVKILGFALFYIESFEKKGGHTKITGRFIEKVIHGGAHLGQSDYGALGVTLVE